jgi:hypothetical protein
MTVMVNKLLFLYYRSLQHFIREQFARTAELGVQWKHCDCTPSPSGLLYISSLSHRHSFPRKLKGKSKVVPLRCIEAHLGDRRYSSYSFLTSALEGGEWSASGPGRPLPPGKEPPVPTVQEAGWAPQPVWTQRLDEKSSASVGDRTPAVHFQETYE